MATYEIEAKGMKVVIDDSLLYTETDEWVRVEGDRIVVGITDYAQKMLKDVIGVELPERGRKYSKGEVVAVLESIKATGEVYAPASGTVVDVNERLIEEPELVNKDPYGEGWIFAMKADDRPEGLLTHQEYAKKLAG